MTITVNLNRTRCYRIIGSKGDLYDIDLNALAGNGACDCPNFIFKMEDAVQMGSAGFAVNKVSTRRLRPSLFLRVWPGVFLPFGVRIMRPGYSRRWLCWPLAHSNDKEETAVVFQERMVACRNQ